MIPSFEFRSAGALRFGRGCAEGAAAQAAAEGRRVLLLRSRSASFADVFARQADDLGITLHTLVQSGEPDLDQLVATAQQGRGFGADAVVAIGGGSVIDMGKAAAALIANPGHPLDYLEVVGKGQPLAHAPLPFLALPTTAGTGAEVTKNAVIAVPSAGRKVSLRDARMLPRLALVDPALTDDCPSHVTLASGLDALTQVIEPYVSVRANPLTDSLCRDAIGRGLPALHRLMREEDRGARDTMALVSVFGGMALANSGLGAVHGLAGVIGGRCGAPHGAVCGRLLPAVLRMNETRLQGAGRRFTELRDWIAAALGSDRAEALDALESWIDAAGLPRIGDMGVRPEDHAAIAEEAQGASSMKGNPVALNTTELQAILEHS